MTEISRNELEAFELERRMKKMKDTKEVEVAGGALGIICKIIAGIFLFSIGGYSILIGLGAIMKGDFLDAVVLLILGALMWYLPSRFFKSTVKGDHHGNN